MIREKMQNIQMKRVVILSIPYLIIFYLADKCFWLYRHCIGDSMIEKIGVMLMNFQLAFTNWLPSFYMQDLLGGLVTALIFRLILYYKVKNAKKFRHGEEYGSARWGNRKDIEPFEDPVFENNIILTETERLTMNRKNAKKFRHGEEYGSARWGNRKDIEPFEDPVFENNIILTETERLTMNSRPKAPKYARNKNVIVIGGSGSGKTRFYVKPNLMQMTDRVSYVVTDPKGTIIVECGKMLVNGGYRIKVLNTINFKKSMHYNPFHYIRSEKDILKLVNTIIANSEKDILKLVNTIIANTKGEGEKSTEDFWIKAERLLYSALIGYIWYEAPEEEQNFSTLLEFINASETREDDEEFNWIKAERLLYSALIGYIWYEAPEEEQNFSTLLEFINASETREDDEEFKNAVDELFEELEAENPEHFAVRQYQKYKLAAGKTAKSILISCGARLAPFDIQELREIMSYDEMELDMIGDQKTAMFVIISDTDDTFNFVVAIMYTQLFNLLCDKADDEHGGKSILISCGARLAPFDIQELREIMSYDEMELDMIGDQKTAMFVIISDTDDTFNFVVAIMYTQLFNLLCDKADDEHGGRLPYHVRLLLDEFSNIGQIPKFDKLIATIRSREISASIILQSQSQLKTIYKDAAETITGNCDTVLFLGGKESSTLKELSETLGKETIDLYNTSDTRGTSQSYGLNYQKTGKELMSRDELAVMDGNKCILQLRGVRPFLSNKYDITKHKRYKELADADKRNAFDVEKYLEHKLVFSQDTEFEVYEVNVTEEDVKVVIEEELD